MRAATQLIYFAGSFSHQHAFNEFWKAHDRVEAKKEAEEFNERAADDLIAQRTALPMDVRPGLVNAFLNPI